MYLFVFSCHVLQHEDLTDRHSFSDSHWLWPLVVLLWLLIRCLIVLRQCVGCFALILFFLLRDYLCFVSLPRGAKGWSVV